MTRAGAELRLSQAWHEVLGTPLTSPSTNFFHQGGSSLQAARLVGVLGLLGFTLTVEDVLRNPTWEGQAQLLRDAAHA